MGKPRRAAGWHPYMPWYTPLSQTTSPTALLANPRGSACPLNTPHSLPAPSPTAHPGRAFPTLCCTHMNKSCHCPALPVPQTPRNPSPPQKLPRAPQAPLRAPSRILPTLLKILVRICVSFSNFSGPTLGRLSTTAKHSAAQRAQRAVSCSPAQHSVGYDRCCCSSRHVEAPIRSRHTAAGRWRAAERAPYEKANMAGGAGQPAGCLLCLLGRRVSRVQRLAAQQPASMRAVLSSCPGALPAAS